MVLVSEPIDMVLVSEPSFDDILGGRVLDILPALLEFFDVF